MSLRGREGGREGGGGERERGGVKSVCVRVCEGVYD